MCLCSFLSHPPLPLGTGIRLSMTPSFPCFCDLGQLLYFLESEFIHSLGICASAVAQSSLFEVETLGLVPETSVNGLLFLFINTLSWVEDMWAVGSCVRNPALQAAAPVSGPATAWPLLGTALCQPEAPARRSAASLLR